MGSNELQVKNEKNAKNEPFYSVKRVTGSLHQTERNIPLVVLRKTREVVDLCI